MKIEIEVNDIESLSVALHNATVVYGDICWAVNLGLTSQVPMDKMIGMDNISKSELKRQIGEMKNLYNQIQKVGENG